MRWIVGIDAGGTKTVGLLADEHGTVHAEARAGGANLRASGELAVEKAVYEVLEGLDPPGLPDALCIGIAGVDRPGERSVIAGVLRRLGLRRRVRIETDALVALVAGARARRGIVVVSGTGSIGYGIDSAGTVARSGGWGYLLGDEGSAFWIGHAAIRLGIRAADGRGEPTSIYERVCRVLELGDAAGLVAWFYDQEHSRHRVAELAPLVQQAADDGDGAADELLEHAATHLVRAARAVARQLAFSRPYPLVLAGGAFLACPSLVPRFERRLDTPLAEVRRLHGEPALGAVALAREMLDAAGQGPG